MNFLVPLFLFGWIPVILILFLVLPSRRAVLVSFLGAWLFLPNAVFKFSGIPDYDKMTATVVGVLLGTILFDLKRLTEFKPRWYDMPIVVLCLSPFLSSIQNNLGTHDGISAVIQAVTRWGIAYFIGRMYFNTREGLRELAIGVFIGGLIYLPLCLWEIRMSPRLHYQLYGMRSRGIRMGERYGGYRPLVFMWTYLPVVHWMTVSTVIGFRLWATRKMDQFWGFPTGLLLLGLTGTVVMCKTFIAFVLLPLGVLLPMYMVWRRSSRAFALLVLIIPMYIWVRASGMWTGYVMVDLAKQIDESRAKSLEFRLVNENQMSEKALQRPYFGWGRWGRARVLDERGRDLNKTDGRWILTLGEQGLVGLAGFLLMFMLPLLRFIYNYPGALWSHPLVAPAAAIAMMVFLTLLNNLLNSTVNPVVTAAIGGLSGLSGHGDLLRRRVSTGASNTQVVRRKTVSGRF